MSVKNMKPVRGYVTEEIAEVHTSARSPSPKHSIKTRSRSRSNSRRLSNGHTGEGDVSQPASTNEESADKPKTRDNWIKSDQNESLDIELPIHDQIKQGILGFVENEIKKTDATGAKPSFVFYSHDPNDLDEKFLKTLSRPSSGHSGHKEKRSPSFRKKKRHSSRARERDLQEFEIPGSSLSALEKVDDYLKEYNKEEVVTLSGELEIEPNDVENNNGNSKELRHKPRKTRRKVRDDRQEGNSNGNNISPKVFKVASRSKGSSKPARPTDLTAMLESLEASRTFNEQAQYIDNPFSSPSPLTSPNDERLNPFSARRTEKVYLQGGGTFRAVSRDLILGDSQRSKDGDNFMGGSAPWSPLQVSLQAQRAWRRLSRALPGLLAGAALLHAAALAVADAAEPAQRALLAAVTAPYAAGYYALAVLCLVSVLDRLDPPSMDLSGGLHAYSRALALAALYGACVVVSQAARPHDEMLAQAASEAGNYTQPAIPEFYATWMHLSVWRSVLAVLADAYLVLSSPPDLLLASLTALTQYQHHLLDPPSMDLSGGLHAYSRALALAALYGACVVVSQAARPHDEMLAQAASEAGNYTQPAIPEFYATWMHLSVWRSVLAVLADAYLVLSSPPDLLLASLTALTQYQHHLQPRG